MSPTITTLQPGIDYVGVTTPLYCYDGKGKFLLHKRSVNTRDEQGRWDPGAGKLEFGISLEENVLKEIEEEYGCAGQVTSTLPPQTILRTFDGVPTHWIALSHFVRVDPAEVRNNEPHKIDEIGWFSLDNLPEPLHTGFAYTLRNFREHFRKYER